MKAPLEAKALGQLFTEARTHHAWTNQEVTDQQLAELYELTKWGPTALNAQPMRILYIKSAAEKEKLFPSLMGGNVDQAKTAPVVAVIAFDEKFFDHLPELFPDYNAKPMFETNATYSHETAFRNSSLQGAYFVMAARALGFDVCPMSGFDANGVNEAFFKDSSWKANFICTLGFGDDTKLYPRGPRLSFDKACRII